MTGMRMTRQCQSVPLPLPLPLPLTHYCFSFTFTLLTLFLYYFHSPVHVYGQQKAAIYSQIFNTSTYDPTIRPNLDKNLPVIIDVNYRLNLLYSVSAANEVYSIDLYVR